CTQASGECGASSAKTAGGCGLRSQGGHGGGLSEQEWKGREDAMEYGLLIDNKDVAASGGTFERMNPASGTVATTAGAARAEDVDKAVQSAAAAFKAWSKTGPFERRKILNRAADILDEWTPRFIELGIAETGGSGPWHGFNMMFAAKI